MNSAGINAVWNSKVLFVVSVYMLIAVCLTSHKHTHTLTCVHLSWLSVWLTLCSRFDLSNATITDHIFDHAKMMFTASGYSPESEGKKWVRYSYVTRSISSIAFGKGCGYARLAVN